MDENNSQPQVQPAPIYQESNDKNAKWLWLLIFLIIIGALVFAFFRGIGPFAAISPFVTKASPTPSPSPFEQTAPISESSPSSSVESLDKSSVKVKVLNGSGVTGKAATVKVLLESAGWSVAAIGNADNSDYKTTEVKVKDSAKSFLDAIVKDLSDKYSAGSSSKGLEASDSADIVVIVGTK